MHSITHSGRAATTRDPAAPLGAFASAPGVARNPASDVTATKRGGARASASVAASDIPAETPSASALTTAFISS